MARMPARLVAQQARAHVGKRAPLPVSSSAPRRSDVYRTYKELPNKAIPAWLKNDSQCSGALASASYLANYVEMNRRLPAIAAGCGVKYNTAQFAAVALQLLIKGEMPTLVPPVVPPEDLYVSVDYTATLAEAWSREEYMTNFVGFAFSVFQASGGFKSVDGVLNARGGLEPLRFVELVYHLALILRHVMLRGDLPPILGRFIVNPEGLVPWPIPSKYQQLLGVREDSGVFSASYSPFPSHRLEVFQFAWQLAMQAPYPHNPYVVGYRIYQYSAWDREWGSQYERVVYNLSGLQFGDAASGNAWDSLRLFWCNSAFPKLYCHLLLRALGIPSVPGGQFYLDVLSPKELQEWKTASGGATYTYWCDGVNNMDSHSGYGNNPELNKKAFHNCGDTLPLPAGKAPTVGDARLTAASAVSKHSDFPRLAQTQALVVFNGYDVVTYGADYICEQAQSGGFTGLVLTVRDAEGRTFFETAFSSGGVPGTLETLTKQAKARGLKVYAAVSVMAWARGNSTWQMKFNQIPKEHGSGWLPTFVSPCADSYFDVLGSSVSELASRNDLDGVFFINHFYPNVHGELPLGFDWHAVGLSVNHIGPAINVVETNCSSLLPWEFYSPYALLLKRLADLASRVSARGLSTAVGGYFDPEWPPSAPTSWQDILDYGSMIGLPNQGTALKRFGYQHIPAIQQIVSEVVYTIPEWWATAADPPVWQRILDDHHTLTGTRAGVSFFFLDEWQYDDRVYRGLLRRAAAHASTVMLHSSPSSTCARVGAPAFSWNGWKTIGSIHF